MSSNVTIPVDSGVPVFGRVDQIGILVDDIEQAIVEYSKLYPVSSWRGYQYAPDTVPELGYRGEPGRFSIWLALSDTDPQIELIQSLAGPSIYTEWLDQHGAGLHHLGTFTKDLASDVKKLEAQGLSVSQWGRGYGVDGDGGFAYFDSVARLGMVVELIEVPARRRTPDRQWAITR